MSRSAPPLPSFIIEAERKLAKAAEAAKPAAPDIPSPINVEKIDRNINGALRKQIVDIINNNPDVALAIVRGWKDR